MKEERVISKILEIQQTNRSLNRSCQQVERSNFILRVQLNITDTRQQPRKVILNIEARNTAQTAIVYNDVHVANPYHPIFEGVDFGEFQGFDEYGTVAEAVVDTTSTLASSVPGVCSGYSDHGGYFQRLMQTLADDQDILLGTCNHGAGGMIVTTIDVERESERADSVSFPLLGNLLSHHLDAYPNGFGGAASGTDITLNGNILPLENTRPCT